MSHDGTTREMWDEWKPPVGPGDVVGDFVIEGHLGSGGMGTVLRAREKDLDREVAIKFVKPRTAERFRREAKTLAALEHPHIVRVYRIGACDDQHHYLVMQLVRGGTLAERAVPSEAVLDVAFKLVDAVGYAHTCGVLHRDLKPNNVIISEQGHPFLTDFGLAKALLDIGDEAAPEYTSVFASACGTPGYMAPEQYYGGKIGTYTDVFGLGGVLYFLLTRKAPPLGTRPIRPSAQAAVELDATLWPPLDELVGRCLEPVPEARFQTVREIQHQLRPLLDAHHRIELRRRGQAGPASQPREAITTGDDARVAPTTWTDPQAPVTQAGPGRPTTGHTPDPPSAVAGGDPGKLGPYTLVEVLEQEGMTVVHRGRDERSGRPVRVRVLREPAGADVARSFATLPALLSRVHHPSIPTLLDAGTTPRPFLVESYFDATPLGAVSLHLEALIDVIVPVCDAVDHLHQHGIVHGDIKPSRILLDPQGRPYLTGFEIAALWRDGSFDHGNIVGTVQYMAPEHAGGLAAVVPCSDVYQLGGVLYEKLCGTPPRRWETEPFNDVIDRVRGDAPVTPRDAGADVPRDLEAVILKAMAWAPGDRHPTAGALRDDLLAFRAGRPVSPLAGSTVYRLGKRLSSIVHPGRVKPPPRGVP